ncbi:hypothetical protein BX661DRAFT_185174 [Kickxella alabastrina]|uniref:uncharacterized protein n=1 Tax=Kickxella alabastrina TaxID=61397 RepID=UPI00221ED338|nr:uncharacterized protein BX661DRAFT_185174 [Kickxella alabastrina]KAI7825045.1 hypothetical protein BX661DRAFT_185174 [Kickxella alabastrina]
MQIIATLLVAASAVLAQQVGSTSGPIVSSGSTAISSPNVNNGNQVQNSIENSGVSGGNTYSGISNSAFNTAFSNSASVNNNNINPTQHSIAGNTGSTVSGQGNIFGSAFGTGAVPPFFAFGKRDAIINNHGPVGYPAGYPHGYPAGYPYGYYPSHGYYPPQVYAPAPVVRYAQPPYTVGIPAAHIEHKAQSASIVQNQN